MKRGVILLVLFPACVMARVLEVGAGRPYATVQAAAASALPGDTILVRGGIYGGGEFIANLQGSPSAWITLRAAPGETVIYRGGSQAWQFTDAAYLRISGFVFESQTGNGVNMDDGGSYDTPAHAIVIENCEWRAMNATGNNDQLKLSGVDTITVRRCSFSNGSAGGSAVDMVGCHHALFEENTFTSAGSNSIQAKGGSQFIRIERNRFVNGGQRALNIGGSTGAQFFRPLNANFEAADVLVYANVFTGSMAPIAYVGAVRCTVANNTIYRPDKWAVRILQETVGPNYLPCGDNSFINNIVVVGNAAANPTINIGSNTAPQTFRFSNNLWYDYQNTSWAGPNLPVTESNGILNRNPLLADPDNGDFSIPPSSPAAGTGRDVPEPVIDFLGRKYPRPRSIGAVEGNPAQTSMSIPSRPETASISIHPNPSFGHGFTINLNALTSNRANIVIMDVLGRIVAWMTHDPGASASMRIDAALPPGLYTALVSMDHRTYHTAFIVIRK